MKEINIKTFNATINLGLTRGYSNESISKQEVIRFIQSYQNSLISKEKIYLSASVSENIIVLSGQTEPHLKIEFINYPRFPYPENILKQSINNLGKLLMNKFEQNRIVIVYTDETIMIEKNNEIDPQII